MIEQRLNRIRIGDWVQGVSKNDYTFQGFVEAISESQGSVLVRIVKSERDSKVGKVIESQMSRIDVLSDELCEEQDFYALIDLALVTRDETWFMELTDQLIEWKAIRQVSKYLFAVDRRSNMRPYSKG